MSPIDEVTQIQALYNRESWPKPRSGMPFLIHRPGRVWCIGAGKVDLFLVRLDDDGEPVGARTYIARFEQGDILFALNMPEVEPGAGLLACPAPDAELAEADASQLRTLLTGDHRNYLASTLDRWVTALSAIAADGIPPKRYEPAKAGEETVIGKEPTAVLADEGVVWVRCLHGSSRFVGEPSLPPFNGSGYLPLASPAWFEAEPLSRFSSRDTAQYLEVDPEWLNLQEFHRAVMHCIVLKLHRAEEREILRLEAKSEVDSAVVAGSLRRLTSPLETVRRRLLGHEVAESADPLLMACEAIGAVSGIRFRAHPNAGRGVVQKDPVADIARASSVRMRRVVLSSQWWNTDAGPLLTIRESDNRPLALLPVSARSYEVFDPVERTHVRVNAKIAEGLGPYAFSFYRPFPNKKLTARDLLVFGMKNCEGDLTTIVLMGVGAGLLGMLTPILTGIMFDTIIPGAQHNVLMQMFVFMVASAICTALLQLNRGYAILRMEGRMDASVQSAVWDRLLNLPVPFFRDYTAGDLAVRSLGISQMRQVLTGSTLSSILSGLFSIFSFFLLFYYSWRMALLATALILVAFATSVFTGYRQVRHQRETSRIRGHLSGMILQFINGISKFRVSGTEGRAFSAWAAEFAQQKTLSLKARKVSYGLTVFNSVFPIFCSGCIFYYLAWLMTQPNDPQISTGDFLAFNAAFAQFLTSSLQLSAAVVSVLSIVPLYERAKPILQTLPEVDQAKGDPGELVGNIEISHLAFRYRPDTPLVLRDVSMSIRAGQFVAVVGASGCGKSTLFRLLLGFETPESGAIFYDGQDVATIDVQALRRQMGVVLQSAKLLSGPIFNNIVGSAPLTIDDAWEAARMAGFDQDVKQMPMGMHTVVSEGGGGLSGGQRQRLMIARAIVGKPRVLLFDEATSALDNQTQAIVSRSLESLRATRIVIAHRLSTIIHADQIFVLDKGQIVQHGTYEELMQQGGLFADLANRQLA